MRRFGRPLLIVAVTRLCVLVLFVVGSALATAYGDDLIKGRPFPTPPTSSMTLRALTTWDAAWYVDIADHGYGRIPERESVLAFFPGFPVAVRGLSVVTGLGAPAAGVLLALGFALLAGVLLWELSRQLADEAFADRAVILFGLFPGSFVLNMAYAEGMMLAASLGCLLALRHSRWWLAGACGAVATLTRPNAVVLVACCAFASIMAIRRRREWVSLAAPVLCTAGITSYFVFLWRRTGDAFAWFDIERRVWDEHLAPATIFAWIGDSYQQLFASGPREFNTLFPTFALLFAVPALVALWRWRPPAELSIFAVGILLLTVGSSNLGLRPRFLLTAFPLVQAAALHVKGEAFALLVGVSAVLLAALTVLTVTTTLVTP